MSITSKYLSLAQADARYASRLPTKVFTIDEHGEDILVDVWVDSTPAEREKALFDATLYIDSFQYDGQKKDPNQEKAFPRKGQDAVPEEVLRCTMDLAIHFLKEYKVREYSDAYRTRLFDEGITKFDKDIGSFSESNTKTESNKPLKILRPYLKKWLTGRFSTSRWRF